MNGFPLLLGDFLLPQTLEQGSSARKGSRLAFSFPFFAALSV